MTANSSDFGRLFFQAEVFRAGRVLLRAEVEPTLAPTGEAAEAKSKEHRARPGPTPSLAQIGK